MFFSKYRWSLRHDFRSVLHSVSCVIYVTDLPLFLESLVVLADDETTNARLEVGDDLRQAFVSHVLQHAEHAGSKEDLRVSQAIVVRVQSKSQQHFLRHCFAVNKSGWDCVWRQNRISVHRKYIGH